MGHPPLRHLALATVAMAATLLAACGGGEATPTAPAPSPTATRPPAPSPTATRVPPTPTPAPGQVPTPITLQGQRGGTLQLRSLFQTPVWDTYEQRGRLDYHTLGPMLNNLIWVDPYGDGKTVVGDTAESWEIGAAGATITFRLRRGIKYHDGAPFTSKDAAYNLDRAWKPRTTTMNVFQAKFRAVQAIETPDDYTVRLTLAQPSNAFLQALTLSGFMMYPSHVPLPDRLDQYKQAPLGTGPYRFKSLELDNKTEYVRSADYFRAGLPYLDAIVINNIPANEAGVAAFRAGRVDATNLDSTSVEDQTEDLRRSHGFVAQPVIAGYYVFALDQKPPFTDRRVREALDLALSRQTIVDLWLKGRGTPYAAPVLPAEMGGALGQSTDVLKARPGYREDKTQDMARARALLVEAGVDPSRVTINMVGTTTWPTPTEVAESNFSALGFKTKVEILTSGVATQRRLARQFDVSGPETAAFTGDEPADYLGPFVLSTGGQNYSKWSNAELDRLFAEQDRAVDASARRQLLAQLQTLVLDDRVILPGVWRRTFVGRMGWVRNFPPNLIAVHSPWFRWEQVWLERR